MHIPEIREGDCASHIPEIGEGIAHLGNQGRGLRIPEIGEGIAHPGNQGRVIVHSGK